MKIGMVTDSLGHLSFEDMVETAANAGVEMLEFACGNWSSAPHIQLDAMIESKAMRDNFMATLRDHNLEISALNCSGNHLAPGELGKSNDLVVRKTFKLAKLLGINRIVMMSGLPGGPGDANPNWITVAWPPQVHPILKYQWEEVAIPYWKELVTYAQEFGIEKICIEQHAHQLVYNTETMLRLRDAVGETVGVNLDPSHAMWMGGDPLQAVRVLGDAIYHVHAKDTWIDPQIAALNTTLETKGVESIRERSWNYVTLGYGHSNHWWRRFVSELYQVGYNDVLSIEHEDFNLSPETGVEKSVALLQDVC